MERSVEDAAAAPSRTTRHLPVVTALWVRRFGQVLLAAVLVAGLALPKPGYDAWGLLLLGGLLAWLVWLLERLVWRHGQLPGNWIHLGLLGPALILAGHLVVGRFQGGKSGSPSDGMTASLMTHAALLSLLVVLTQSFCAARGAARIISAVVAVAMMASGVGGLLAGHMDPLPDALWLLGLAGLGLWLWPLTGAIGQPDRPPGLRRALHAGRLAVAAVATIALLATIPSLLAPLLAAGIVAGTALVAVIRRRSRLLAGVAAGAIILGVGVAVFTPTAGQEPLGWLGRGDQGFAAVTARDGGLAIVGATAGWLGAGLLLLAAAGAAAWMLIRSPADGRSRWAAPLAAATALLATAALWRPGGYVSPAVGMAAAFLWGMLPAATDTRGRPRPAWLMAGVVLALMVAVDLASDPGLLVRAALPVGLGDKGMHAVAGFVLAMVLAWWMGSWRWWAGLLMLIVAGLAGEAGELAQKLYTNRSVESADVDAHVAGVVVAGGVYLLCVMARWAEGSAGLRKPWERPPARAYLGALLRVVLACMLVMLISGWCVAAILTETARRSQTPPWHVATDGVVAVPREAVLHIPGTTDRADLAQSSTTYSLSATGKIERPWHTTFKGPIRVYARTSTTAPGENIIRSAGRPLGALAYNVQRVRWIGVTPEQRVAAMSAATVEAWLTENPGRLRALVEAMQANGPVVVLHPGTPFDYAAFRRKMREALPDVICMNHLAVANDTLARPISLLRSALERKSGQPRQQPVDFIATDPAEAAIARQFFGGSVTIHIVSSDAPAPTAWRKTYPSLDALVQAVKERERS